MIRKSFLLEECTENSELAHQSDECQFSDVSSLTSTHKLESIRQYLRKDHPPLRRMIENVSRRAFTHSTRVYNVRAHEPKGVIEPRRGKKLNYITATVVFLDDTQHQFVVERKAPGQSLLNQAFEYIELIEKDYFGLQYTEDDLVPDTTNTSSTRWLDSVKPLKKQLASKFPLLFLGVRFYPPEPSRLGEEYTRHLLCLQIRKLLMDERLQAPKKTALLLASFYVQAELGDYDPEVHVEGYLSEMALVPNQSAEDEHSIHQLHKLHRQQTPADAEANFLQHACKLDRYGLEEHPAKDSNGKDIIIGVMWCGIIIFSNGIRINVFPWAKIVKIAFKSKRFFIQIKKEPPEDYNTHLGFNMGSARAAKALWRCSVEQHSFFRLRRPRASRGLFLDALGTLTGLGGTPRVMATESQALEAAKKVQSLNRVFVRKSSHRYSTRASVAPGARLLSPRSHLKRVQAGEPAPRPAWGADQIAAQSAPLPPAPIHIADDDGSFLESRICGGELPYADDTSSEDAEDGVVVRLSPGPDGLFGFNVRGGQGAHVLVAKVASDTPAHGVVQEGDRVISINGIEVDELTYEEIVLIIKNTRGSLVLKLKPRAQRADSAPCPEEPASVFVPLTAQSAGTGDALAQSMLLLGDGLASGAALLQYETLLRGLPDEPCAHARKHRNVHLNRYRDIVAYDKTRVILKKGPNGDYINASYINMEIPSSDIVLTYIATQGPLPYTTGDFWQMVWECETTLVVMLTVLKESERAKCHQYWPEHGQPPLKVTKELVLHTFSETPAGHYVHREMLLMKGTSGSCRTINHLQYLSWPDHGVPDDAQAFLEFTKICQQLRTRRPLMPTPVVELSSSDDSKAVLDPPMLVHCSAGVGRTGALILAETALTLMERGQPVYPLDLVRHMREQRPMCIQNALQYKFVCESILAAYNTGFVRTDGQTDEQ